MRCPASSGAHVVPLPVALKLSIHLSGGEEGERLISSAVTDSTITDARKGEEEKKKQQATVTPDHYSSVNILNKQSKSEAS